jgi:hypothetical protein
MNVEIGTEAAQFPEKEIYKWDFRCSVLYFSLEKWLIVCTALLLKPM